LSLVDPELAPTKAPVTFLRPTGLAVVRGLIKSCRPKQWSKNVLLFFGLIFALKLTDPALVGRAFLGFLVFCAASSGVYLINDVADVEKDRQHPKKRLRPLAARVITPTQALSLAGALFLAAFLASAFLGPVFAALTIFYVLLMVVYSFRLKHVVLIDVFVLAAGFVLRAVAGAVAVGVPISPWLYLCTVLASLFLGLAKRRHELVLLSNGAGNHRRILDEYSLPLLDQLIVIVVSATVMAYSLYTFSAENLPADHSMMLTIPFVLYGLFRYLYLVHQRGEGGSPDEALLTDRPLLGATALWLLTATAILYLSRPL
jgi:4-hydroxybenzoate polyprenyltransferase